MCECLTKINEHLEANNTRVVSTLALNAGMIRFVGVRIMTEKINSRKRGKPTNLTAAFCPFCGARYEKESAS